MIAPQQSKFSESSTCRPDSIQGFEIEVLCACDERYLPHAATMLCSLLEHNSGVRIHFFYSSIALGELAKLKSLVAKYGSSIAIYEIVPADLEDLHVDKWASLAVYYRLLAPHILPADVNKVLYLDSDIIVRSPLTDLWNTNITGYAFAAVPNFKDEDASKALGLPIGAKYFNSGVLLMNLAFWRQNDVPGRAISFARNNPEKIQYWDQDALNATLVHQWVELPLRWNWQEWLTPMPGTDPAIVHFLATVKPWHWASNHPFKREYHKYRLKTPWQRYRQEGMPRLLKRLIRPLRDLIRGVLPSSLRQWLRSHIVSSRA